MFTDQSQPASEVIGILAAVVILLIAFGSVLAMGMPIMTALFGIGIGLACVNLLARVLDVPSFAPQVAAMIGIGVGIDYALFVVTRYRQGLHDGLDPEEGGRHRDRHVGRAVLFAGLTVIIALLGMLAIGAVVHQRPRHRRGRGRRGHVMAAAVTLLPAMLGFVGNNIDRLRAPVGAQRRRRRTRRSGTAGAGSCSATRGRADDRRARDRARARAARAVAAARLRRRGQRPDGRHDPAGLRPRSRRASVPGCNGPFLLAVRSAVAAGQRRDGSISASAIAATPGVASVAPPITSPTGTTAVIRVNPTTSPQDEATSTLLHHLRHDVIPQATRGTGADGLRRRVQRAHRRLREPARPTPAPVHRRRDHPQLPAADGSCSARSSCRSRPRS